ncbi:hypothetical protein EMCRGX_G017611 [Ephydatia muelleri]
MTLQGIEELLVTGVDSRVQRLPSGLDLHYLVCDRVKSPTIILIHGNVSSSIFWQRTMLELSQDARIIAPDLPNYGFSGRRPVIASRGLSDFSDDLAAFHQALGLPPCHWLGWSMGGGILLKLADGVSGASDRAGSECLVASVWTGELANQALVSTLASGDTGDGPSSPRTVMRKVYVANPVVLTTQDEDRYVQAMLRTALGPDYYPGDSSASDNWPGYAPGGRGIANAMSGLYFNARGLLDLKSKPAILWIQGGKDQLISDRSFLDASNLGQLGVLPGWPGVAECPLEPMIEQWKGFLSAYEELGGSVSRLWLANCGHSPHLEEPDAVHAAMRKWLSE